MKENSLLDLIFKYKEILQNQQYVSIEEREKDRIHLNEIHAQLQNISQKILDSKCYLQLGKIQENQTVRFLADDTTANQRIEMLAYIVRSQCRPVLFISGTNTLLIDEVSKKEKQILEIDNQIQTQKGELPQIFSLKEQTKIQQKDFLLMKQTVLQIAKKHPRLSYWRKKFTVEQAEILSQLASSGEIEIHLDTDKQKLHGVKTCVVLKE
ncbi:MAG: hypothetical protein KBC30_09600 [Planctomycetes bacterium]|nr:hypothetical protein [Planctomycetota bacterium]HNZ66141.1 hypothetical protein [Planctomycetota bacterium]HPY74649.1 hypothetical protein [Planctomycetota bacterium]HQB00355.1 hypothetical protein [Planctomycetota bacterium]HRU52537.1 hypothetical protein [Planctomycetota bacterium]